MVKKAVHEEILELLPWFINESLGDKERELVMVHLRECPECRKERDQLQTIESFVKTSEVAIPDYNFSYQRLSSRIDEAERNRESVSGWDGGFARRKWIPFAGIAASFAFVVAIVGSFQSPTSLLEDTAATQIAGTQMTGTQVDEYRTLTTQTVKQGAKHHVALTFVQPIQAQTMRQALIETRSNIISGPDAQGTYIVEVNVPPDMSSDDFLQSMRQIEGVKFARLKATITAPIATPISTSGE